MPLFPDYATTDEVELMLGIPGNDDGDRYLIDRSVTAASRMVDAYTRRQFGQEETASTRYYPIHGCTVAVDDFAVAPVAVSVERGTTTTPLTPVTDYRQQSRNAPAHSRPWTYVELEAHHSAVGAYLVLEARFGWAAVPETVKQATQIQALRLFKRKDAAFGIAGSPDMGSELRLLSRLDPDVEALLRPLRRHWGAVS